MLVFDIFEDLMRGGYAPYDTHIEKITIFIGCIIYSICNTILTYERVWTTLYKICSFSTTLPQFTGFVSLNIVAGCISEENKKKTNIKTWLNILFRFVVHTQKWSKLWKFWKFPFWKLHINFKSLIPNNLEISKVDQIVDRKIMVICHFRFCNFILSNKHNFFSG